MCSHNIGLGLVQYPNMIFRPKSLAVTFCVPPKRFSKANETAPAISGYSGSLAYQNFVTVPPRPVKSGEAGRQAEAATKGKRLVLQPKNQSASRLPLRRSYDIL